MTTDELRAKFEAFHGMSWDDIHALPVSSGTKLHLQNAYKHDFEVWQAAHASQNAEVEALKRDAERYRFLRNDTEGNAEAAAIKHSYEDHWLRFGVDLDGSIDAALAKESVE